MATRVARTLSPASFATTYTWNQTGTAAWTTSTNWTPTRTTPATDDILVFDNGATTTVTDVPTQTIGQLSVSGNTTVNLQAAAARTLTIAGSTGTDLDVSAGSALNCNAANAITLAVGTGATGSISGAMTFSAGSFTGHRLTAASAGGITFNNGATFTAGTNHSGSPFGTTSLNSVVFAGGSTYVHVGGNTPFGATQPNSVVVFQAGSLYKLTGFLNPDFSGRTYANVEFAGVGGSPTATAAAVMDNLTVTSGGVSFQMTGTPGHSIKGNISVATGATLGFYSTGTINLNGTSPQTITNAGTLTFDVNQTLNIANANGVTLNSPLTFDGVLALTNGKLNTTAVNLLTVSNTAANAVTGGSAASYVNGPLARVLPAFIPGGTYAFPVGKAGFNAFELVSPTAFGSNPMTIRVEQFDGNSGGTAGTLLSSLNTDRYWQAAITAGVTTLNTTVRLTDAAVAANHGIGQSATQSGTYNSIGGIVANPTIHSTRITSLGFFNLGTHAAPTAGNYPATAVGLGGTTTVTPDAAPQNVTSLSVATNTNFKGNFAANPVTGAVRVTNAHPVGTYPVTVTAFIGTLNVQKTFMLTVQPGLACSSGTSIFSGTTNVNVGANPISVAIGDFNGDGKQDFATANINFGSTSSSTVSSRMGNGLGGTINGNDFDTSVGTQPTAVAIGDFNGDGKQDFAAANAGPDTVSIRLGAGNGGFSGFGFSYLDVSVGTNPYAVAVGDFNGDGKQDFATANYGTNTVSIRLGDGLGGFSGTTEVSVGANPRSVAIGDFNGDGRQDFAAASESSDTVSIRLGDGLGGFSGTTSVNVGDGPISVAIGDFNGDGKQDFAAANQTSSTVSIRLGDGLGGFSGTTEVSLTNAPQSVAIGDFNGDGKQDLAVANTGTVSIRVGDGTGGFSTAPEVSVGSGPRSVAIGDFNGDGRQDLATTNSNSNTVSLRLGACDPLPVLTPASLTLTEGQSAGAATLATAADSTDAANTLQMAISGNGGTTFSATSATLNGVTVTLTDSNAVATGANPNAAGQVLANVAAACAASTATFKLRVTDASGGTDIEDYTVTVNPAPPLPPLGNYPNAMVTLGGGTTVTPDAAPQQAIGLNVMADTNFKGSFAADPVTGVVRVTNAHPAGTFTVRVTAVNNCVSTFKTFTLTVQPGPACTDTTTFTDTPNVSVGTGAHSVAIGDFNGDGKQDFATANANSNTVSIRLGDGLGGFSGTTNVSVSSFPRSVAIGDFNGDGRQDFAAANANAGTVSIRLGDGLGGFSGTTNVSVGGSPYGVAIGDFNGDGKQDFAAATSSNTVAIRLGDGLGGFSGTTNVSVGSAPAGVALGDFNGDGKQDFAAANATSNTVSIRLGDGLGGFSGTTNVSVGAGPYSVAIGDFNGDGRQDFATANVGPNTVSIRLGDGLGGFSGTTNVSVGAGPYSVAIGDFNGDGNQDFATANATSNTVSLRLGDGLGGFSGALNVGVGTTPYDVAVGDFNGDGRQDFAAANLGSNSVSIRLNDCLMSTTVSSINRAAADPVCSGAAASWTVTLAAAVSGLTAGNFNLVNTGLTGPAITTVSGGGATWTVTASAGTGSGSLGLDMVNGTGITPPLSNVPFSGQVYTFNAPPTAANAGPDQTLCATSATLAANAPTIGTGAWSIVSGTGGTVTTPSSPTSTFTGVAGATYTLRWTISNAPCTASTDTVVIAFRAAPTTSNAGPDQMVCGTSATLAANAPTVGTGAWSIVSGTGGTVTTPSSRTSTFTGVAGATYTLRWTISNSPCTASTDDVVIAFRTTPTAANAGPDQTLCATSATLAANAPTVGTGAWSIVSGAGGTVTTPSSRTSTFTGVAGTAYTLRWTISNTPCTASTDDVVITFRATPTPSNAGPDQTLCATSATLAANAPTVGTGAWSIVSGTGGTVTTPSSRTSTFTGVAGATYTLRWTISNSPCTASTDDVVIAFRTTPTAANAGPDQSLCTTSATLAANAPTVGTGAWSIVSGAGGTVTTPSSRTSTFTGVAGTAYTLRWTISNAPCTASTDDVVVTFNALPTITLGAGPSVPEGSTSADLPYTATTGSPNQYSIDYNAAANLAGFVDVVNAALPASLIILAVPVAAPEATYNATLTVRNSTTGCVSGSVPFTVTLLSSAPMITAQPPAALDFCPPGPVYLGLTASGTGLSYQWRKNGNPISNNGHYFDTDTNRMFINDVTVADTGSYDCVVMNSFGTVTSTATALTISAPPTLGNHPNSMVTLGGTTTVTPDAAPQNATSLTVATDTNFKGSFAANPATGVVSVTNAHPAGTYTVTVTAANNCLSSTKTFTLTVQPGLVCTGVCLFSGTTNVSVGTNPYAVALGDFNGDGKQDFAAADYGSNTVSIRLGDGLGGFSGTTNVSVGTNPQSVAVGDFNGDGKQDFAAANYNSNTVSIRLGDGLGGFSGATEVSVGTQPISVAIGDFNGDGKQDFAAANHGSNTVSIRLGNGLSGFIGTTNVSVGAGPYSVAIGDFNGDGKQDLAAANHGSNTVSIRLGDGLGDFSGTTEVSVGTNPQSVTVGDFNGDGKQDLAAANHGSNTVSIRLGDGLGDFSGTTNVSVGTNPQSVAIGDFNGDGRQDFAAANYGSDTVSIRLGDGLGGFSGTTNVSVGTGPVYVALGDFNGDGRQDFAAANYSSNTVSIRLGGCDPAPVLTPAGLTIIANQSAGAAQIATASDSTDAANTLQMSISGDGGATFSTSATLNGVTVTLTDGNAGATGINPDAAGQVLANVATTCAATNAIFKLRVTDSRNSADTKDFAVTVNPSNIEINVKGNGNSIPNGTSSTSTANNTDFGMTAVGVNKSFTIENPGTGSLTVSSISFTGANSGDFAVYGIVLPATITPGNSTTFNVTFTPGAWGLRTATIYIANDDCDENPYYFSLRGTGLAPEINLTGNGASIFNGSATPSTSDNTDFGVVNLTGTTTRTFTIENQGNLALNLTGTPRVAVSGTHAAEFTVTTQPISPVTASGSTTFVITFAPGAPGTRTATVSIANDDADENPYTFAIQGGGCATNPVVQNTDDSGAGSLRQAILDACPGSTITFASPLFDAPQTITLTSGELLINKNLTINGPGANKLTVSGNNASRVFSIHGNSSQPAVAISGLTVTGGNGAGSNYSGDGGGVANFGGGTLTISNSRITGNTASANGGGILNHTGTLRLTGSTVAGNTLSGGGTGGGICNQDTMMVTNSTISGNQTNGSGGGGGILNNGSATITSATITGNSANGTDAAGGFRNRGTATVRNSIIAGNTGTNGATADVNDTSGNPFISEGYNLIGDGTGATGFNGTADQVGTTANPINALLGPLADNGGPTPTHALMPGSPAIDKGKAFALTTDQRGRTRLEDDLNIAPATGGDNSDIGAFELTQCTPPTIATQPLTQTVCAGAPVTFSVVADGSLPISYQWKKGNVDLNDQNASSLTINSTTLADAGSYTVVITNACGMVTSQAAVLTVNPTTAITAHPQNQAVNTGQTATFSVTATGTGPFSYQWKKGASDLPDTNSPTLTLNNVSPADNGSYSVTVTGVCGTINSNAATLAVNSAPTIGGETLSRQQGTAASTSRIATVGDADQAANTLTVTVTPLSGAGVSVGTPAIDAAGNVTASVAADCTATNSIFTVKVTDSSGVMMTATLTVNVTANTPPTLTYATPQSVTAGNSLSITTTAATDNGGINGFSVQSVTPPLTTPPTVNSSGVVSITAAGPSGAHDIVVRATDNCGAFTDFTIRLNVDCQAIAVGPASIAAGSTGIAYSQQFTQTGGIGAITFSTASALPTGITLTPDGLLSGMTSQTGSFPITIKATDGNGCMGSTNYTLSFNCPTITVLPPAVTTATAGAPFSQTFSQTGGAPGATTFSTISALPTGLTLSSGGLLSGTPTVTGVFVITVSANSIGNCSNSINYTLTINCPTIALSDLPAGTAGTAYNQSLSATPAGGNYSFAPAAGSALPPGLNLAGGVLTGTPTQAGTFNFTITATGFGACTGSRTYTFVITCPAITLSPANLPNAAANTAYNQSLSAAPSGTTYSFAVTGGLLPNGLTLNANGSFSGAPTNSGTFNFRVTATGWGGCTGFRDYVLAVGCPTITLAPTSLPSGTVGAAYNQSVAASPAGTYSYAVSTGALPNGLTLNGATGALTGTPSASGTFNFTIRASQDACSSVQSYSVTIACTSLSLTTTSPANGQAGIAYSQTLVVTPAGSYTFAIVLGNLPSGLTLNTTTGVISGLPNTVGTSTFSVRVQTTNGCSATQAYSLTISCPTVTLAPSNLPNGTAGTAYSQTPAAGPAGGNYTYAVTSGTLPAGLALQPATGIISGTPTTNGSSTFTVTATGFGGCSGSQAYTIVIGAGSCATVTLPASLPNGTVGGLYSNSVAASPAGSYSYAVSSGTLPPGVTLYGSFGLLFGYPTAVGSYTFTVTATQGACTASQSYTVLIGAGLAASLTVASDFDGDLKSDVSVFRADGNWAVSASGNSQMQTTPWGAPYAPYFDLPVSGDYDGDGKTDLAVFRRGTEGAGHWFIKRSSDNGVNIHFWGLPTDVPVPGDYDGDGKTDVAVWRGSEGVWFVIRSSDGAATAGFWGTGSLNDTPVPGDYDGDGKTDYAVFRRGGAQAGHWLIKRSSDGKPLDVKWGLPTDAPVPGDYDGDNKTDYAVWRASEGVWYWVESGSAALRTLTLGETNDLPVPTDYDGDGKADPAVWQPTTGKWQIKRSSDGAIVDRTLGRSNDLPIPGRRN